MLYFDIFLDDSGALTRFRFAYAMEQNWNQKVLCYIQDFVCKFDLKFHPFQPV